MRPDRPLSDVDMRLAADLVLAYMADDDDAYAWLLNYAVDEFDPATMISGLIALLVGTCKGFGPDVVRQLGMSINELRSQPVTDEERVF